MAKVLIPAYMDPFAVTVNNRRYTFQAGEVADVPDEVAELILDYYESKNGNENEPNAKVDKDPASTVPFAVGLDDGGLYCVTK